MSSTQSLDENYSTTKRLIQEKPIIVNSAEDTFETVLFLPDNPERKGEGGLRTHRYFKKSYEDKPLITVITVVFNGKRYLEETILSVINQTYDNVECIIIDGGSIDGTLDIIKKYEEQIDYWVSEADEGIYDAMNKGLIVAKGEYVAILNADDYYTSNAISLSIEKIIETNSDYSIANVEYVHSKGIIRPIFPLVENYIYQEMPYPHVSAVIASKVYRDIGLFDEKFRIAGDHDMALRIHLQGYKSCYINEVIARLEEGGISSGMDSNKESLSVAIKNGKNKISAFHTYLTQILKVTVAKVLPTFLFKRIQEVKGSRFR